jgi:GGDEF domain-containing protein
MWNIGSRKASSQLHTGVRSEPPQFLSQDEFLVVLSREKKRTERSNRPFVLMLLDCRSLRKPGNDQEVIEKVLAALARSVRETDVGGWYEDRAIAGVSFTEIGAAEGKSIASALLKRVANALSGILTTAQISQITLSFRVFPEARDKGGQGNNSTNVTLDSALIKRTERKRTAGILTEAPKKVGGNLAPITF